MQSSGAPEPVRLEKVAVPSPGEIVLDRYKLADLLGSGAFGCVFSAKDVNSGSKYAVKIQNKKGFPGKFTALHLDNMVLTMLHKLRSDEEKEAEALFPKVYKFAIRNGVHILVMELLGPSLQDIFNTIPKKMDVKTILLLMDSMITALEKLHSLGFVHRDIKPDNIALGGCNSPESGRFYLIDFGVTAIFKKPDGSFLPENRTMPGLGTHKYMATRTHDNKAAVPQDDLESLAYVAATGLKGNLPWSTGIMSQNQSVASIKELKSTTSPQQLFAECPVEFGSFLESVKKVGYGETPDYAQYRNAFRNLGVQLGIDYRHAWKHVSWYNLEFLGH